MLLSDWVFAPKCVPLVSRWWRWFEPDSNKTHVFIVHIKDVPVHVPCQIECSTSDRKLAMAWSWSSTKWPQSSSWPSLCTINIHRNPLDFCSIVQHHRGSSLFADHQLAQCPRVHPDHRDHWPATLGVHHVCEHAQQALQIQLNLEWVSEWWAYTRRLPLIVLWHNQPSNQWQFDWHSDYLENREHRTNKQEGSQSRMTMIFVVGQHKSRTERNIIVKFAQVNPWFIVRDILTCHPSMIRQFFPLPTSPKKIQSQLELLEQIRKCYHHLVRRGENFGKNLVLSPFFDSNQDLHTFFVSGRQQTNINWFIANQQTEKQDRKTCAIRVNTNPKIIYRLLVRSLWVDSSNSFTMIWESFLLNVTLGLCREEGKKYFEQAKQSKWSKLSISGWQMIIKVAFFPIELFTNTFYL